MNYHAADGLYFQLGLLLLFICFYFFAFLVRVFSERHVAYCVANNVHTTSVEGQPKANVHRWRTPRPTSPGSRTTTRVTVRP